RRAGIVGHAIGQKCADTGYLRELFQIEHDMKDGMRQRQFNRFAIGEHALDFVVEMMPLFVAPKIIDHQKAAAEQVVAQYDRFVITEIQSARAGNVNKWIILEIVRRDIDEVQAGADLETCRLVQSETQCQIRLRSVVIQGSATTETVTHVAAEAQSGKGECVVFKSGLQGFRHFLLFRGVLESVITITAIAAAKSAATELRIRGKEQ